VIKKLRASVEEWKAKARDLQTQLDEIKAKFHDLQKEHKVWSTTIQIRNSSIQCEENHDLN